ncbi:MAG: hypothetical protein HY855_12340 [Burkholderiales bacterium]|nr:hypothetical protein [Burkholderiales bacterium]
MIIEGREALRQALRGALLGLGENPARVMWWVAPDYLEWPLDEPGVLDALTRWARPHGRLLRMVGLDFESVSRHHPRFTDWRRQWAHRFEALRPVDDERAELPTLMLAGQQAIEVLDRDRWRSRWLRTPSEWRALQEQCEAIAQRCEPAWPSTMLGL